MQRLLISLLICLGFVLPATAQAWWQDDWHYRKQISIDTTPQGAAINQALGRTALLVRLHTGNFSFDGVKEDGSDLRFVSADDKTVFNHQIESFDPLMGMALVWVDVPNVEGGQRQDIWMYYGNQKAPASANGQLTFDPNYIALYHFDGANGTPAKDTTAYGNHAQNATGRASTGSSAGPCSSTASRCCCQPARRCNTAPTAPLPSVPGCAWTRPAASNCCWPGVKAPAAC
ncbi:hypothetical protein TRE132_29400 [Pseudomonas chlororaphis subsp. aurantiaca]|nr:hypothetical protein TRE132_29400 [Pseudomonas chlororaphis subsp. aurantiaca]